MEKRKIKITYSKDDNEIEIIANESGLKFLSDICLRVIGNSAGHFHLMEKMNNLEKGSIDTVIVYSEDKI